ncbi:hypothetical protein D3C81_1235980 [compost metagenome]
MVEPATEMGDEDQRHTRRVAPATVGERVAAYFNCAGRNGEMGMAHDGLLFQWKIRLNDDDRNLNRQRL